MIADVFWECDVVYHMVPRVLLVSPFILLLRYQVTNGLTSLCVVSSEVSLLIASFATSPLGWGAGMEGNTWASTQTHCTRRARRSKSLLAVLGGHWALEITAQTCF